MTTPQTSTASTTTQRPLPVLQDFKPFATALAKHFDNMSKGELYRVDIDGDAVWQAYLAAFPPGTNPIYRERTEHDGSYDKNFIRQLGNVVAISDSGSLITIWDVPGLESPYKDVCNVMVGVIKAHGIAGLFRTKETTYGRASTVEALGEGKTHTWYHFHAKVAARHHTRDPGDAISTAQATFDVTQRGFVELLPSAIDTVLDLIDQKTLYKGDEFKAQLLGFKKAQDRFLAERNPHYRVLLVWRDVNNMALRIRNTAIGTLLQDLSDGKDLEAAVKSYEQKVAPYNYKRPTALITKVMVEKATETIRELGLESALERRHAKLGDISVTNVLWVDGKAQPLMKDGLTAMLMAETKTKAPTADKTEEIAVADFLATVLPQATGLELYFRGGLQANLVSLTAPVHSDAGQLFKWADGIGWSYNGNVTDSIKERVKAAGGNVDAKLRVSLAWYNTDDLDLHAHCPDGHVYYGAKGGGRGSFNNFGGRNGQILDVDMNVGGETRTPVENLSWRNPADGEFRIQVNQYRKRETKDIGFSLQLVVNGQVTQYSYPRAVNGMVDVLTFTVRNGEVTNVKPHKDLAGNLLSQDTWSIKTEQFVKVNVVLNSPNHWDESETGNKHLFFILDGCLNDEPTRGIYNEFLKPELEKHRKVFEVLGNKTKCPPTTEQLSGLGFSTTQRNSVVARVTTASSTRLYNIQF